MRVSSAAANLRARPIAAWRCSVLQAVRLHEVLQGGPRQRTSAYVSIRQHTSAYVSIRQHTSAYVSIPAPCREEASEEVRARCVPGCTLCCNRSLPYDLLRQHASAYVIMPQSIRQQIGCTLRCDRGLPHVLRTPREALRYIGSPPFSVS
jgi:hypothetical protein